MYIYTCVLFCVGLTPFGFFSESKDISFALRDASKRHVLFTELDTTISSLTELLSHSRTLPQSLDLRDILTGPAKLKFIQRWNVIRYKLTKSFHLLSVLDYDHALYYARSTRHDLSSLHELIHGALDSLDPVLDCSRNEDGHDYHWQWQRWVDWRVVMWGIGTLVFSFVAVFWEGSVMEVMGSGKPKRF